MGGRALLCLDQSQPSPGQGCRGYHPFGTRLPLRRLRHAPHPPTRTRLMNSETDSESLQCRLMVRKAVVDLTAIQKLVTTPDQTPLQPEAHLPSSPRPPVPYPFLFG